jgi:hypothetical protein
MHFQCGESKHVGERTAGKGGFERRFKPPFHLTNTPQRTPGENQMTDHKDDLV